MLANSELAKGHGQGRHTKHRPQPTLAAIRMDGATVLDGSALPPPYFSSTTVIVYKAL